MKYINIHTHQLSNDLYSLEVLNGGLNDSKLDVFRSFGIHPWCIKENSIEKQLEHLKDYLSNENCLALGECGLDKNISVDFELQEAIFLKQLDLNRQIKKPVIIHCVKAFQEIISIRKTYDYSFIIHGFNKKIELANQLIKNDFHLSFGKSLLYKENLQEVFKQVPLDRIFLETDDAYISIKVVYKKAAELRKITLEELILALYNNFKREFNE